MRSLRVRGVEQHKVLGYKIDLHQPAAHVFNVPYIGRCVIFFNALAHVVDIDPELIGITWFIDLLPDKVIEQGFYAWLADDDTGLGERHVFKGPCQLVKIMLDSLGADGQQSLRARGPKAGIHLIEPAGFSHGGQRTDIALGEAVEIHAGAEFFVTVG